MSASVRIETGISAGTTYWIDRPVLRVGSDPQCEICLPTADQPPHTLTLEFRGGAYRAYNRGTAPISVGRSVVQPGAAAAWDDGQSVTLPGEQRLVLTFDGDPRPSPRPDAAVNDGFDLEPALADATADGTPEAVAKGKSKTMMQMLVILVCLVATGGFLMISSGGTAEAPAANRPTFQAIVESSLSKDGALRALVQQLQYAQSFLVRGNAERARTQFTELRDQLSRQKASFPAADAKDVQAIQEYVELQLGRLN
jgi:hypothetical protein